MSIPAKPHEVAWIKELERRRAEGEPPNNRERLVKLREILPAGFKVADLNPQLMLGGRASVQGLLAIGDPAGMIPEVDRTIRFIRDRLIQYPNLEQITALELADNLKLSVATAEYLLYLTASLGPFTSTAAGA